MPIQAGAGRSYFLAEAERLELNLTCCSFSVAVKLWMQLDGNGMFEMPMFVAIFDQALSSMLVVQMMSLRNILSVKYVI